MYTYDYENRLIQITLPGGSVVNYQYDPLGRRIQKTVNGVVTKYLYDREDILKEYDGSGTLLATYIHGPGIDEPVAMTRGGQTYYYHADGLGSIEGLTNSSQAIVQTYQYDSYGNITNQTGTIQNSYTYTGREYDAETGLYYYRARYYDQQTGRFLNQDPIGFTGGDINFYRYVGNNPVNRTDPLGLFWGIPMGESYGEAATEYYANITTDPCSSKLEKAGAWAGGILSSLWTSDTSAATFFTLTGAYGLRNAGTVWKLADGSPARYVIDYGDVFRLEQHMIGKGALRGMKWHIHALWDSISHWPWNY